MAYCQASALARTRLWKAMWCGGTSAIQMERPQARAFARKCRFQSSLRLRHRREAGGEKLTEAGGGRGAGGGRRGEVGVELRGVLFRSKGTPASESVRTEVPLSVVIAAPASPGGGSEDTYGDGNTLSMIVDVAGAGGKTDGAIDFGTASRGSIALQNIMLKNGGSIAATVSASVSGNAVFRRYLRLDEKPWREYQTTLPGSANSAAALSLPIPADYAESGAKSGSLIFWATPTAQ